MTIAPLPIAVIADDLSGAAELAAAWPSAQIAISSSAYDPSFHTFIDTGTRDIPAASALVALDEVLAKVPAHYQIYKKVDSLLRGNTAAELAHIARTKQGVVLATANPANGRMILDSHLFVEGQNSWTKDLKTLFDPDQLELVLLHQVRSENLARTMEKGRENGKIIIADSRTVDDLVAIADAVNSLPHQPMMAGSAGLFHAMQKNLNFSCAPSEYTSMQVALANKNVQPLPISTGALCVLGSIDTAVSSQLDEALESNRAVHVEISFENTLLPQVDHVRTLLARGKVVFAQVARQEPVTAVLQNQIAQDLANWVASVLQSESCPLAIIGGSTAHASLRAMGVESIQVVGSLEPGSAISYTSDGQLLVTRPGSYGDSGSLRRIADFLVQPNNHSSLTTSQYSS